MLFIGHTSCLSVSFFVALGLRYLFTRERMGVPSLLRMWLISKPFTLCSPTCSVLHTAHFACSQVLNRSAILVGSEIPYLAEQRSHARKINSIFIQVQAKTRSEEKDELHMTGTEIIKGLTVQASLKRHNKLRIHGIQPAHNLRVFTS